MAQLEAGYESGSGFRDAFARIMGAPPASRAARALFAAWLDTPLGPMTAIADDQALYLHVYVDRRGLEHQIERLRARARAGIVPGRTPPIAQLEAELGAYFSGSALRFATPLAPFGSAFQRAVWDELRAIPPGGTRSYAEIAGAVGRPAAARAAARANGANPLAIVIPCHRVLAADGTLGGYGGGLPRKRWLLAHERRWRRRQPSRERRRWRHQVQPRALIRGRPSRPCWPRRGAVAPRAGPSWRCGGSAPAIGVIFGA
jgi:AraC family transcriptional regulator of adaptative response/methylated-DNA-[protein]-cysteine methyltransferase